MSIDEPEIRQARSMKLHSDVVDAMMGSNAYDAAYVFGLVLGQLVRLKAFPANSLVPIARRFGEGMAAGFEPS